MLDQETLRRFLGTDFDPEGEYTSCSPKDVEKTKAEGYREVARFPDPTPPPVLVVLRKLKPAELASFAEEPKAPAKKKEFLR